LLFRNFIRANVDDDRAGLNVLASDHSRSANGDDEEICLARYSREIARA
jgi:hypothetical protein